MPAFKSLSSLFDRLRKQKDAEQRTAAELYASLVVTIADGEEEPSIDEIMPVLADAGKTPEDLEAAVGRLLNRREWKKVLDRLPKLEAQRQEIAEALEAERAKFLKQRSDYEAAVAELNGQANIVGSQIRACEEARVRLSDTADKVFSAESTRLNLEVGRPLAQKLEGLQKERERLSWDMQAALREHQSGESESTFRKSVTGDDQPSPAVKEYERLKQRSVEVLAEIEQTQAQIEKLDRNRAAIHQEAMVP